MPRPATAGTLCLALVLIAVSYGGHQVRAHEVTSSTGSAFNLNVTLSAQVSYLFNNMQCQKTLVCRVGAANGSLNRILEVTIFDKTAQTELKKVASIFHLKAQELTFDGGDMVDMLRGVSVQNGALVVQEALPPGTGFAGEDLTCKVLYADVDSLDIKVVESGRLVENHTHAVCKAPDVYSKLDVLENKLTKLSDFEERNKVCKEPNLFNKLDDLDNKVSSLSDVETKMCNLSDFQNQLDAFGRKLDRLTEVETKITEFLDVESGKKSKIEVSCDRFRDLGEGTSPRHMIERSDGTKVLCDTETDGGGWTVFQRRFNGSLNFYRSWEEYEVGFGDPEGELWMGLKPLQSLLQTGNFELRVDLESKGSASVAVYSQFKLSPPSSNYKITLGSYSGTAGDSLRRHNGWPFSTKDRDNDKWKGSCAQRYQGGWWYDECHTSNLNGVWASTEYGKGLNWVSLTGYHTSVSSSEMKVRRRK